MGTEATAKATRAGISTETEPTLNPGLAPHTVAYDDDQIDEWGFLRQTIENAKAPDLLLANRKEFYGYVLENVKSPRSCAANPVPRTRKRKYRSDKEEASLKGTLKRGATDAGAAANKLLGGDWGDPDFNSVGVDLQYAAGSNVGLVRIRIPELDALPPPPITPVTTDGAETNLCKRSSAALQSATTSMTRFYPLFSYKSNFEFQKFLVPGALVRVEYDEPVVSPRPDGPASSPESAGKQTPYGVLRGTVVNVVIHETGQPVLAFSAYQSKTQGSDAFGDAKKCKQLMFGAALAFGTGSGTPLPPMRIDCKDRRKADIQISNPTKALDLSAPPDPATVNYLIGAHARSPFGVRFHAPRKKRKDGTRKLHAGIDVYAPEGSQVYAIHDGVANFHPKSISGYGQVVILYDSTVNRQFLYAHLSKIAIKKGQVVKAGQLIGYVGRTAHYKEGGDKAKGGCGQFFSNPREKAHVHLEVLVDPGGINRHRKREDPKHWLKTLNRQLGSVGSPEATHRPMGEGHGEAGTPTGFTP